MQRPLVCEDDVKQFSDNFKLFVIHLYMQLLFNLVNVIISCNPYLLYLIRLVLLITNDNNNYIKNYSAYA